MTIARYAISWLGRIAVTAVALFGLAGPAQAAVYAGIWDPTYGAPFTNLGWRGSSTFFVPDGCKATGTADVSNTGACGGAAEFLAADVEFYDTTDPAKNTLISFGFDPNSLVIDTLRFIDGALTELTTTLSNFVLPDADLTKFGVSSGTQFSLQFTLEGPRLAFGSCNVDTGCTVSGFNDSVNFPPTFVITEVPEPRTLWMVVLALALLAAMARKAATARRR